MKYQLFDYQRDAALGCLKQLRRGRRDWQEDHSRSSFALSSITGEFTADDLLGVIFSRFCIGK